MYVLHHNQPDMLIVVIDVSISYTLRTTSECVAIFTFLIDSDAHILKGTT